MGHYDAKTQAVTTPFQKQSIVNSPKPLVWLSDPSPSPLPKASAVFRSFPHGFLQKEGIPKCCISFACTWTLHKCNQNLSYLHPALTLRYEVIKASLVCSFSSPFGTCCGITPIIYPPLPLLLDGWVISSSGLSLRGAGAFSCISLRTQVRSFFLDLHLEVKLLDHWVCPYSRLCQTDFWDSCVVCFPPPCPQEERRDRSSAFSPTTPVLLLPVFA